MYLDIELSKEELRRLERGGFLALSFPNGIRITVVKENLKEKEKE